MSKAKLKEMIEEVAMAAFAFGNAEDKKSWAAARKRYAAAKKTLIDAVGE